MIEGVVVAALALAAIVYVLAPLRSGPAKLRPALDERRAELVRRKHAALTAIVDLEEERAVGKLSTGDFDALVGSYETEAVAALEGLDSLKRPHAGDDLEEEIALARARLRCPNCGALLADAHECA
jgi:hypothetical protein